MAGPSSVASRDDLGDGDLPVESLCSTLEEYQRCACTRRYIIRVRPTACTARTDADIGLRMPQWSVLRAAECLCPLPCHVCRSSPRCVWSCHPGAVCRPR